MLPFGHFPCVVVVGSDDRWSVWLRMSYLTDEIASRLLAVARRGWLTESNMTAVVAVELGVHLWVVD